MTVHDRLTGQFPTHSQKYILLIRSLAWGLAKDRVTRRSVASASNLGQPVLHVALRGGGGTRQNDKSTARKLQLKALSYYVKRF